MSSNVYSGTIAGTGVPATLPELTVNKCIIDLDFAGTATVELQWKVDGVNWKTYASYTADAHIIFEPNVAVPIRLNCTAYTNDVDWAIRT